MDNASLIHSFIHSDTFIFMIETYLSLFKCLVRLITQRIHVYTSSSIPCPRPGTHDCISNSAIYGNNFASLLSDH